MNDNRQIADLCDFVHAVQKERGFAILYLREQSRDSQLIELFQVIDQLVTPLESLTKVASRRVDPLLAALRYLPTKRRRVLTRNVQPVEVLNFYTVDVIGPALDLVQELMIMNPTNQPTKISALVNLLQWKERIGLERAIGAQFLGGPTENNPEFAERLAYLLREQEAYERMFLAMAGEQERGNLVALKGTNQIFQKIDRLNRELLPGHKGSPAEKVTAAHWFELFTEKLDLLRDVEQWLLRHLSEPETSPANSLPVPSSVSGLSTAIDNKVRAWRDVIDKQALFNGLTNFSMDELLRNARLVELQRGSMVFLQGEPANRLYMILDGWVKLYKGQSDGQESILQVLGRGETLLETAISDNIPFPVHAQAVENTVLLSIPAPIIREKLQNDKDFALNMMSTLAGRSQALIAQLEQLTLKSAQQRVGWFLLRLFIQNGGKNLTIGLPYDKAVIAGYLGMKPETFSRTLQNFKDQGFDIDRQTVTLPDISILCNFCDLELAGQCQRSGSAHCPNPECTQTRACA